MSFMRACLRHLPFIVSALVWAPQALADMRCPPHVVTNGMTLLEVRERCGPPVFEDHRYEELAPGIWIDVDEWTYELGANKFRRLLRFENGRLERIEVRKKPVVPLSGEGGD
jgi:hypothetical protein